MMMLVIKDVDDEILVYPSTPIYKPSNLNQFVRQLGAELENEQAANSPLNIFASKFMVYQIGTIDNNGEGIFTKPKKVISIAKLKEAYKIFFKDRSKDEEELNNFLIGQ